MSSSTAKLSYSAHALMENRNGLLVDFQLDEADGYAERRMALEMLDQSVERQLRSRRHYSQAVLGYDHAMNKRGFFPLCVVGCAVAIVTPSCGGDNGNGDGGNDVTASDTTDAGTDVNAETSPPVPCGNGVADPGEACDGSDLGGYTCTAFAGYAGGSLHCRSDCRGFDLSGCTSGSTIPAASCDYADVLAAVGVAKSGDTVTIPAGVCTWTSTLTVGTAIALRGLGTTTSPTRLLNGDVSPMLVISDHTRVTNIYFDSVNWTATSGENNRTSIFAGGSGARIDHCVFDKGRKQIYWGGGLSTGLLDHDTFLNPWISFTRTDVGSAGTAAWNAPIVPGTANAVVFEDDQFIADDSTGTTYATGVFITHDEDNASRTTIRKNSFSVTVSDSVDGPIEAHGNQDYVGRGAVMLEIYDNDFAVNNTYRFMNDRGGSWLVFDNRFTYSTSRPMLAVLTEEEAWQTAFFNPLRTVWSAQDQINSTFFWGNTMNGSPAIDADVGSINALNAPFIQQDRDYFMHAPCDGTIGCTGGKTVWIDPSNAGIAGNESWVASGPNAYYPYVPLVYPHPLVTP